MPIAVNIEHLNSYWRAKAGETAPPQGLPSYLDLQITGNPYYSGSGWLDAWCLNPNLSLTGLNSSYSATAYSSYELNLLPAGLFGSPAQDAVGKANLDLVNWVLNQDYEANPQFNYGEVQSAMWKLLGYGELLTGVDIVADGPVLSSDVNIIYNAALTHNGFVPDTNQSIAVVLHMGPGRQPVIIEVPAAKLGDYVWHDVNASGEQDAGEIGIAGATVKLVRDLTSDGDFDDANEILATTKTDGTGYYEFAGLTPGLPYQVQFVKPAGFDLASPRQASGVPAALDSDALTSDVVTLMPGEFDSTIDAGFYRYAGLGDYVWHDVNANGEQELGESGIVGATVELVRDLNTDGDFDDPFEIFATTTTDATGYYEFKGLTPGIPYQLRFSTPTGFDLASPRQASGVAPADDSDALLSDHVVLASGEFNPTIDAGFYKYAGLGDFVWNDADADGKQEAGEAGIADATVKLVRDLNTDGDFDDPLEVFATTTTDSTGYYEFKGLTPGIPYQVQFSTPAAFPSVSPRQASGVSAAENSDGLTSDIVVLASGEFNPTIDAGFYKLQPASLGDFVWLDKNADGAQNVGEQGIAGVTVTLLADLDNDKAIDDVVATQLTDATGLYKFDDLTPGTEYRVEFTNPDTVGPDAYTFSPRQASGNPATDSDGALSDTVVLSAGEYNPTIDAGLYRKGSIHVFGFLDKDGDGAFDSGEAAFPATPGKTIRLLNAQSQVIATDITDANGEASFDGLTPGTYTVMEDPVPQGYALTTAPSVSVVIGSGEEHVYKTGAADLPPGDGRTEMLDTSLMFGNAPIGIDIEKLVRGKWVEKQSYDFDCKSLLELFWKVKALIHDIDYNWCKALFQQAGDLQAAIKLVKDYFENLQQSSYKVVETADFDADTPTGPEIRVGGDAIFTYLVKNTGAVELSDVKVTDDRISTLTFIGGDTDGDGKLDTSEVWKYTATEEVTTAGQYVNVGTVTGQAAGQTVTDSDAAHYISPAAKAKVGDRVWCDKDMDGVQDAGESGVAGITVKLKDSGGNVVQTTKTDSDGEYYFDVAAGTYSIVFDKPTGYTFTGQDKGGNDATDSDASSSGATATFTVAAGEQKFTIDAGIYVNGPKFFVVDTTCDDVFKYNPAGSGLGTFDLRYGNSNPTGIAANPEGSKLWVLDSNKNIYIHNANGSTAGQWKAGDLGTAPEGIAVFGQDVWIVDSGSKKIYWYDNGASFTSGTHTANKTFTLGSALTAPKGIATDGDYLWLVNDGTTDKVFVYDVGGAVETNPTLTALGSWTLSGSNAKPTGLTIDPTGSSMSIWVVDNGTDKVYEYANARGLKSGSGPTPTTFNLAYGNSNPQDIADPLAFIGQTGVLETGVSTPVDFFA